MAHELWLVKGDTMTNITPIIGSLSWTSSIETLGDQLDFSSSMNDARFFPSNPIEVGDAIILQNEEEIFRGIVVVDEREGRYSRRYTGFDPAFYLNKSKDVFQFNTSADQAITQILNTYNVPIGSITSIPSIIKKIFNSTVSEMIKEIISLAENELGTKYRMEMRQGKLYIENQEDLLISGTFQLAANIAPEDLQYSISNPRRRISIEEMRNSIKIVSNDNVVATVKSDSLIDQYGLLQEVQSIDNKDIAQSNNIAQNLLNDLGKIFEDNSFDMIGDDRFRSGRLIQIEEPLTGMTGKFLIKSVVHRVEKGIHKMSLQLVVA